MIYTLRNYYDLCFLFIQGNRETNITKITEDSITYNKLCFNPYQSCVYYDIRLKKDYVSEELYNKYENNEIYSIDIIFYNESIHRTQKMTFNKILKFANRGSYYELKLVFTDNWCMKLLNEYRLPYDKVQY